jgi:hypothetical protein
MVKKINRWTDDELDMLEKIGTNMIGIEDSELEDRTDADVTEWSTDVDILDLETEEYSENY